MKNECKTIQNMILEGSVSAEVTDHMKECGECRALAESAAYFKANMFKMETEQKTVPAGVDSFIRAAARQKLKNSQNDKKTKNLRIFFEIGSLAALFVFAMVILYQPGQNISDLPEEMAAAASGQNQAMTASVQQEATSLESELDRLHAALADISDDLNDYNFGDDSDNIAEFAYLSQIELDYALYQTNF